MAVDTDEVWERFTLDGNEAITGIEESLLKLEAARGNRDVSTGSTAASTPSRATAGSWGSATSSVWPTPAKT